MSKKVEIIIGKGTNQVSLDLTDNAVSIALQYSIDDVRNIEVKNSNHSKTISLVGTKKNNIAFGGLFDINSTFDRFNPNVKIDARIVVDSSPVLEGYLQLISVNKLNDSDLQGNNITYSAVITDNTADFFKVIGDKKLSSLDFSTLNHTYNRTNIENAWNNHTFADVYQYPLLDKDTQYYTNDFKPAFYHKALLLKVAEDSGYKLEGSFITGNTQYDKEIIAWDGETPTITDSQALEREFKSSFTGGTTLLDSNQFGSYKSFSQKFIEEPINFDDITTPFFDNTSGYDFDIVDGSDLISQWTVSNTGKYDFNINVKAGLTVFGRGVMRNSSDSIISNSNNDLKLRVILRDDINGTHIGSTSVYIDKLESLTTSNPLDSKVTKNFIKDLNITLSSVQVVSGQKVNVYFQLINDVIGNSNDGFSWTVSDGLGGYQSEQVDLSFKIFDTLSNGNPSYWENKTVKIENVQDGDEIELSQYLPKEIKQKDLFVDLIRRYNLYYRKHATKNNTLILETRDDFYNDNVSVLDWTQKKDYSSADNVQFLSELQNKEILYTHKEDSSNEYSKSYNKSTGDFYGQKKISFDNDFVQGIKKIESIFSTSPLIFRGAEGNDVIVPSISTKESKRNPSLLYWGGLIPVVDEDSAASTLQIIWGTEGAFSSNVYVDYSTYPYAGHYDNPRNPTLDINFGEVTFEYYGVLLSGITNGNMFNKYWRNHFNQISTGKLVTSKFYLNEIDINFIKDNLNARIFIKDSYYNINKITDYKPLEDGLTTVELLRIDKGSTFVSSVSTPSTSPSAPNFYRSFSSSSSNNVNSSNAVVIGERNYIGNNVTGLINGNDNNIGGGSTGVSVQGNNNTVLAGLSNVVVVGDNVNVTESNTSSINGVTTNNGVVSSDNIPVEVRLEIGAWDMDTSHGLAITNTLSATELLTVSNLSAVIIDDSQTAVFSLNSDVENQLYAVSGNFLLNVVTGGAFDNNSFNDATINRGFIDFKYTPD